MNLKLRLDKLESNQPINQPTMPEGLSAMEAYLWLVRQPVIVSRKPVDQSSRMLPEEAYAWMVAG